MYDESGRPIAFALSENGGANEYYFYESNIFGDITAIYDDEGNVVAQYKYDAWGNFTAATSKNYFFTDASLFKYRGYIYDWDTGFYYLQSRYYDPAVGRFLNADDVDYLGANGDLTSYNLFAYCSNNPVILIDHSGNAWYNIVWDWLNTISGVINPTNTLTALGSLTCAVFQGRWNDIVSDWNNGCLNPLNQSETVALNSKVLSFYKGSTVVRQNVVGTCSMFGTIWAENGINADALNHEFGHSVQERLIGPSYLFSVAIPSMLYYCYDVNTNGTSYDYYSMPWERTADWFGGVNRSYGYKSGALGWAVAENMLGPIVIPFYLLFGY